MKAIVTGAAQGIGAAIVDWCTSQGGTVVGIDRNPLPPDSAALSGVVADLSDPEAVQRSYATAFATLGGADHCFFNAGIACGTAISELDPAQYFATMRVNVDAMVLGTSMALRTMGHGHIVLTASLAGLMPLSLDPVYTASKHAIVGFVRAVGHEAHTKGITVQALCPGFTETALLDIGIRPLLEATSWPIMPVADAIEGIVALLQDPKPGACWITQAGHPPSRFQFSNVPDPK